MFLVDAEEGSLISLYKHRRTIVESVLYEWVRGFVRDWRTPVGLG